MKITLTALIIGLAVAVACVVTGGNTPSGALKVAADNASNHLEDASGLLDAASGR